MKPTFILAAAVVTGAALVGFQGPTKAPAAKIGEAAPTFSVAGADGKTYNLKDLSGKYVVLEWTNKDCPFVHKHYDGGNMQETQAKAVGKGAVWLSICSSAVGKQGYLSATDHLSHMKEVKSKAKTVLLDTDGKVGKLYGARTTPQIVIISPKGELIYNGGIDDKATPDPADIKSAKNYALAALDEAMAGKAVSTPTSRPYGCSVKY